MIKSGPGNLYSAVPCVGHDEAPAAGLLLDGWRLLEDSHSLTKPWGFAQGSGKHFLSCNMGPPGDAASRQEGWNSGEPCARWPKGLANEDHKKREFAVLAQQPAPPLRRKLTLLTGASQTLLLCSMIWLPELFSVPTGICPGLCSAYLFQEHLFPADFSQRAGKAQFHPHLFHQPEHCPLLWLCFWCCFLWMHALIYPRRCIKRWRSAWLCK